MYAPGGVTHALRAARARRLRHAAGARRTSPDAQPVPGCLADEPLLVGLLALGRAALLESLQELLDLLDAEATLSAGGAIRLEVAHIGPTTDGAERDPEGVGGLRS